MQIISSIGLQITRYQTNIGSTIWELTADKMYSKVKGYIENFADYFPDMMKAIFHQGNTFGIY